jgi:hypothetical protein
MPLKWPVIQEVSGNLPEDRREPLTELFNAAADRIVAGLAARGLPAAASPLFQPWNLIVVVDAEKIQAVFTPLQGGTASIRWLSAEDQVVPEDALVNQVRAELGTPVAAVLAFPRLQDGGSQEVAAIGNAARAHVDDVERATRLARLGDLSGLLHLETGLRSFLDDHPDPERNIFIMMRFLDTPQMEEIHRTIKEALEGRGFKGIRADDRDYTGELWTNIEVCMIGCRLGVAVFEDIEERDFNPNVSLELGYMLGRQRRCLLLKEQRLPTLPTDVLHRLYKPFDQFNIGPTVTEQVTRWVEIDLGSAA